MKHFNGTDNVTELMSNPKKGKKGANTGDNVHFQGHSLFLRGCLHMVSLITNLLLFLFFLFYFLIDGSGLVSFSNDPQSVQINQSD